MKTKLINSVLKYDGTQLKSLWAYLNYKILGPSVVAFRGPCEIHFDHMVDGEDLLQKAEIRGDFMLHFIFEIFDRDLAFAVCWQRFCVSILKDYLNQHSRVLKSKPLRQSGDDLYWGDRKLSISIATSSPVSQMVHLAVNIVNEGTPVKTIALQDLKIQPEKCACDVMKLWQQEFHSVIMATQKVRPVS